VCIPVSTIVCGVRIVGYILYCRLLIREGLNVICSGPPSVSLSCVDLSDYVSGAVNVTVSWTLSGGDSADFYLINITTNALQTSYGRLLNITTASVTQYELIGFMTYYEYNITVRGVNCGNQEGRESEPLTITPQGMHKVNTECSELSLWTMFTMFSVWDCYSIMSV